MVREWSPPARAPAISGPARRSTTATSIPARASSPASIIPVGPPPAITTACSFIGIAALPFGLRPGIVQHVGGLVSSPPTGYKLEVERGDGPSPNARVRAPRAP